MKIRPSKSVSLTFAGVVAMSLATPASAHVQEIWFNMTNYASSNGVDGPQCWNKLFVNPDTSRPSFMNHVQVVAAAGIAQTPDDVLSKTFARLKEQHVKFAIESLAQSWVNEPPCGHGVESFYDPPFAELSLSLPDEPSVCAMQRLHTVWLGALLRFQVPVLCPNKFWEW